MSEQAASSGTSGLECRTVSELLPWWLNGTLDKHEARLVEQHLRTCDACREELRATRRARDLHAGHVPAEDLVDFALGQLEASPRLTLVRNHLEACAECQQELELVCEPTAEDAAPLPFRRPQEPGVSRSAQSWRRWALAASLIAVVLAVALIYSLLAPQITTDDLGPLLNTPVVNLLASTPTAVSRGSRPPAEAAYVNDVEIPPNSPLLTLVLLDGALGTSQTSGASVEILDAGGEPAWRSDGLLRNTDGHFTLTVPAQILPAGSWTLQVSMGEQVLRYEVRQPSSAN